MSDAGWALGRLATSLGRTLERDWDHTPRARQLAWARRTLAGVVAVILTLLASIALLQRVNAGANQLAWEESVLRALEMGPVGFGTAVWLQTFGSDFMLIGVVVVTAGLAIRSGRPLLALTLLLTLLYLDAIVRIGWFLLERDRPAIIAQGVASPGFHSFPSGHTAKTLAVYGLLCAQWFQATRNALERGLVLLLALAIAIMVPYGRVRMGVHWPTDIIGGWLLAGVWLVFAISAARGDRAS